MDPLIGVVVGGAYRIERRIGVGGMGTVYLGSHTRMGQKVAIKVLHERYAGDAQLTLRFEKEAQTYCRLSHPNLVGLRDYGRTQDGTFYMVLEYCPGTSLSAVLRSRKRLEAPLAVDIVMQVAQGLTAAHAADIIHRDLKPENLILMEVRPGRYHVKLLDFGIAKSLDDDGPKLTQAGMVFGTPEYMAPEQARGEAVDARSDIYALGCMLYELLTGKPPFPGKNKMQVMHAQASDIPASPRDKAPDADIPGCVEDIVLRCLEKTPADRYSTASALIEAFEAALGSDRLTPLPLMSAQPADTVSEADEALDQVPEAGLVHEPFTLEADAVAELEFFEGPDEDKLAEELLIFGTAPVMRRPSGPALGVVAAVFCGVILAAAWLFSSTEGDSEGVAAVGALTQSSPEPAEEALRAAAEAEAARAEELARRKALADAAAQEKAARAKKREAARTAAAAKKVAAEKSKREAAKAKAEAAKKAALAQRKAEEAAKKAELDRAKALERALAEGRKALRLGRLELAKSEAQKILSATPDHKEAKGLQRSVNEVRQALALGRLAFDGADCVKAIQALTPVLEVSPGAPGVSHMVNSCQAGLPPAEL